ncbi:MAG: ribonuclease E inhibitor RraB [Bacteroidetes bacterium]|nr:ribonuclease E inhibitor RraB [Bacteroidota bacterium]
MITRDSIRFFFDDLKDCGLDGNNALTYGYFFTDRSLSKLEVISEELVKLGYTFVDVLEPDNDDKDDEGYFYLHVEKVEKHNVDSLDLRNMEFYKLAHKYDLDSYDGFDAGPIGFDPERN